MRILLLNFSSIISKIFLIVLLLKFSINKCNGNPSSNKTIQILESNLDSTPPDWNGKNINRCTEKICDPLGGECINYETCKCRDGYTTLLKNSNMKLCNYQRKSSILAAFIELFLGFGLGHLYSGRKIYGIFKLIVSCLLCCIGCCAIAMGLKLEGEERPIDQNTVGEFFYFVFVCIFNFLAFWQILDFVLFIFKIYVDGNDIPLS